MKWVLKIWTTQFWKISKDSTFFRFGRMKKCLLNILKQLWSLKSMPTAQQHKDIIYDYHCIGQIYNTQDKGIFAYKWLKTNIFQYILD